VLNQSLEFESSRKSGQWMRKESDEKEGTPRIELRRINCEVASKGNLR
jgi:hypothetical protein